MFYTLVFVLGVVLLDSPTHFDQQLNDDLTPLDKREQQKFRGFAYKSDHRLPLDVVFV